MIRAVKRRRILVVVLACVAIAVIAAEVWPREREPQYKGKKLSEWLAQRKNGAVIEAVTEVGTNGLPYLVRCLNWGRPDWEYRLMRFGRTLSPKLWAKIFGLNDAKVERMQDAIWAFEILGPRASPAVPGLVRLMKQGNSRVADTAVYVLGGIGEEAVPALLNVLTNRQAYPSVSAGTLGTTIRGPLTNGFLLIPVLVSYLKRADPEEVGSAATMLGDIGAEPAICVPALVSVVGHQDRHVQYRAVISLGKFGTGARGAVGALIPMLNDPDPAMKPVVEAALRQIEPEVLRTNGTGGVH